MAPRSKTSQQATQPKTGDDRPWPRKFVVTEKAGPKVAGRRVKAGETIELGELESAHEFRIGTIVEADAQSAGKPGED